VSEVKVTNLGCESPGIAVQEFERFYRSPEVPVQVDLGCKGGEILVILEDKSVRSSFIHLLQMLPDVLVILLKVCPDILVDAGPGD